MEKTIFDIMSNDPLRINEFSKACDDMARSQYILADSKITAILQSIATSSLLYSLFDRLLENYDYQVSAKACVDSDNSFNLPSEQRERVCLIFCLLLDMDKHNIEIKDFISQFDRSKDINTRYDNFLAKFILPLKVGVLNLIEEQKSQEERQREEEIRIMEKRRLMLDFERSVNTFLTRVNSDSSLGIIAKDELTLLFGDLLKAIQASDEVKAKKVFSKLVRKLNSFKPSLAKELEKLDLDLY
jgi:hypothetical protein